VKLPLIVTFVPSKAIAVSTFDWNVSNVSILPSWLEADASNKSTLPSWLEADAYNSVKSASTEAV